MTTGRINQVAALHSFQHEPPPPNPPGPSSASLFVRSEPVALSISTRTRRRRRARLPPAAPAHPVLSTRPSRGSSRARPPLRKDRFSSPKLGLSSDFPRAGPSREPPGCERWRESRLSTRGSSLTSVDTSAHRAFAQAFPPRGRRPKAPPASRAVLPPRAALTSAPLAESRPLRSAAADLKAPGLAVAHHAT